MIRQLAQWQSVPSASTDGIIGVGELEILATGWVVDHFSYSPILVIASLLPLLGTALLFAFTGRIQAINLSHISMETA